jgi:hypothetical protein
VCWIIWLTRNNFFFSDEIPSISTTVHKTLVLFKSWNDIHHAKPRLKNKKRLLDLVDITTGWFDGATLSNGTQRGAGGPIRLSNNTSYRWTFNCGPGTNTRDERLGA